MSCLSHHWSKQDSRQSIQSLLVLAWATRLGTFLLTRVMRAGKDKRFDKARNDPKLLLVYWTMQGTLEFSCWKRSCPRYQGPLISLILISGVWVYVTLLPTLILNQNPSPGKDIGIQDIVGWSLWAFGMTFEVVADLQKSAFSKDPGNKVGWLVASKHHNSSVSSLASQPIFFVRNRRNRHVLISIHQGKFIASGLWSISRHPNYFGEITLWFGLYISASTVFRKWQYLSVLSPFFVYLLITRVSGIPLLEKDGLKKWGSSPDYQLYLKRTPVLVPFTAGGGHDG